MLQWMVSKNWYKILTAIRQNGPDGVSSRILKECVDSTSKCLVFIFNASLEQGIRLQKTGAVQPSHLPTKGGKRTSHFLKITDQSKASHLLLGNYLSISYTVTPSTISKSTKSLQLSNNGSRKKRSCETQPLKNVN